MVAEHVIGLRAGEHGDLAKASQVAARFAAIVASGQLRPRVEERTLGEDGHLQELDRLAGDHQYVFFSVGEHYRLHFEGMEPLCYGFVADAATLINEYGALVGPDLLADYEDLMEQCIAEVAATLPPLDPISDAELAEFVAIAGDDPAMLAYVREQSVHRDYEIDMAIRCGDMAEPGAAEAVALFQARVGAIQTKARRSGAEALVMLEPGLEILVPGSVPVRTMIGTIEGGILMMTKKLQAEYAAEAAAAAAEMAELSAGAAEAVAYGKYAEAAAADAAFDAAKAERLAKWAAECAAAAKND